VKYAKPNKDGDLQKLLESNGGTDNGWICYNDAGSLYYIDRINDSITAVDKELESEKYDYILTTGTELKPEEEEQPKFKVGDVVKDDEDNLAIVIETGNYDEKYISLSDANNPDCGIIGLATPSEIAKWNKEVLEPNHRHYSTSKRKIIHWFLPFGKVIVKEEKETHWRADFFSNKEDEWYCCMSGNYEHCLPYNDKTAKLIGTMDEYEEK